MTSQGTASNHNGRTFEDDVFEVLSLRHPDARRQVLEDGIRFDIVAGGIKYECKYFSGMTGTIWLKIIGCMWSRRRAGAVVYILGGTPADIQIAELKAFATEVVPAIRVVTELEFYKENLWQPLAK